LNDLTQEPGEDNLAEHTEQLYFGWKPTVRRYRKIEKGAAA
jgi:hypothetical protein